MSNATAALVYYDDILFKLSHEVRSTPEWRLVSQNIKMNLKTHTNPAASYEDHPSMLIEVKLVGVGEVKLTLNYDFSALVPFGFDTSPADYVSEVLSHIKQDVLDWADQLFRYPRLTASRTQVLPEGRIWVLDGYEPYSLFRVVGYQEPILYASGVRTNMVPEITSTRAEGGHVNAMQNTFSADAYDWDTPQYRGVLDINEKPCIRDCRGCGAKNLSNYMIDSANPKSVVCIKCFKPKTCADCEESEIMDFYTSERDGREICEHCFKGLNKKMLAKEKGFTLNGELYVDPEIEAAEKLKRRRIGNSVAYARGLKRDGLVSTKKQAAAVMKEAGCVFVEEALATIKNWNSPKKTSLQEFDAELEDVGLNWEDLDMDLTNGGCPF